MLVERGDDLAALYTLVGRASTGHAGLLLIEAEAGAGKTALLEELRDRVRAEGLYLRAARGGRLEQPFSYGIARQLFEPVLAGASPERRARLTAGVAEHAAVVLEAVPDQAEDEADSLRTHHGLYWLVANMVDDAPLVLIVDDVHWADLASLRWLAYLLRRAQELPLLVALATRPEADPEVAAILEELADDPLATILRPSALSPDGTRRVVEEVTGEEPSAAFAATAHRVTGGNPFYLRELLRTVGDTGLRPDDDGAAAAESLGPERVGRSVWARVTRAGEDAVALAHALAVLDGAASVTLAARVAQLGEAAVYDAAEALGRAGILTLEEELDYTHAIVRSAVEDRLGLAERRPLHVRAAVALLDAGEDPGRVAVHLLRLPPRTPLPGADVVAVLRSAAQETLARGEPDGAVELLERALAEHLEVEERRDLHLLLARAQLRRRDAAAAQQHYDEAIALSADAGARVQIGMELALSLGGEAGFAEASRVARRALAEEGGTQEARDMLLGQALDAELLLPDRAVAAHRAITPLRERLAAGEELTPPQVVLLAHDAGVFGEPVAGLEERATALLTDPRMHAGDAAGLAAALGHALMLGEDRRALHTFLGEALRRAVHAGDRTQIIRTYAFRCQLRLSLGDATGAEQDVEGVLALLPVDDAPHALGWCIAPPVGALTARGRPAEALEVLETRGPRRPWPVAYQFAACELRAGEAHLALGNAGEALAAAQRAAELTAAAPYAPELLPWRFLAALAHRALGDEDAGLALAREDETHARASGIGRATGRALLAQALCSRGDRQLALLEESIGVLRRTDGAGDLAHAQLELGAALRRAGRRVDAREALRASLDAASRGGLAVLADRAREELTAAGARPRRERLGGVEALTASERRVVDLAAAGATNRQIAQELFLTQKTVETHLSSAYRKLDISSRAQLGEVLEAA